MNMVDGIARRTAMDAVRTGLEQMAAVFEAEPDWLRAAGPQFVGSLVGKKEAPKFTADQITEAFSIAMQERKSLPKPAHVAELARSLCPLPAYQKKHTDPTPQRQWTAEERAANIAKIEAMQAFLDSQEPEFRAVLSKHGYGSAELKAIQAKHKAELQEFIQANA